ncbi:methyltransferase [Devosia sp. 2618]|uniref:methyltransferase n=1 Tax=Devosia sp. 2618 TaxID=3156454 RepID=UPI00339A1DD7
MPKPSANTDPIRMLQIDKALAELRMLRQSGNIDQAAQGVAAIVQAEPNHVGALRLMASLAMQTGTPTIAIGALSHALANGPRSMELLLELGDALNAGKQPAEAVSAYKQALAIRPKDGTAFRGLAQAQLDMGNRAEALKSFRKTLSILPYDKYSAHMIAALSGENTATSTSYVPELFDTYADQFDEHLTGTLEYHVPETIREIVIQSAATNPIRNLLDLGCGTGLVGAALHDLVPEMDGIDISHQMVRKARDRNIYRHLRTGDVTTVLAADPELAGPYDLITAADVFIYVGALDASFAAVASRLSPNGLFAFTVETAEGHDLALRSSGRFGHPPAYVADISSQHGLHIVQQQAIAIRQERNLPIPGELYLLSLA